MWVGLTDLYEPLKESFLWPVTAENVKNWTLAGMGENKLSCCELHMG